MPEISVIVPAYNVEKYIEKCIDSLLQQTFEDFEIILIDDGSTDDTPEICDRLALKDSRIKVFHKDNGGIANTRNYGVERVTGQYIAFVDSDDYVSVDYLNDMYTALKEYDCDIAMLPAQTLSENSIPKEEKDSTSIEKMSAADATNMMLLRDRVTHACWGKLYHRELWNGISFLPVKIGEDYAVYYVFAQAKSVVYISKEDYYYIQHEKSLMHQKCSKKTLSVLKVSKDVTKYLISRFPECRIEALELQSAVCLKNMQAILNTGYDQFPEYQNYILKTVRKNAKILLFSPKVPVKDKIKMVSLLISKRFFLKLYNHFDGDVAVNE